MCKKIETCVSESVFHGVFRRYFIPLAAPERRITDDEDVYFKND